MLKSPEWHLLIVWYFFLGGIAGGAYFTAAIADNFGGPRDRNVVRTGYILSLLMIGVCGMLLILDLGTPSRFMNMMGAFKFKDPMSIGAWVLGVFGLFAFVSSALSLSADEARAGAAPFVNHAMHLTVHGVLHLLGFDHETSHEARVMEPLETRILNELGVADPYATKAA